MRILACDSYFQISTSWWPTLELDNLSADTWKLYRFDVFSETIGKISGSFLSAFIFFLEIDRDTREMTRPT